MAQNIIIRAVNWVGDAIMTLPTISNIADNFPQARLTVLAKPWVAPIYQQHPQVDRIIIYEAKKEHHGFGGLLKLIKQIRNEKFDSAWLLPNSFSSAFIFWAAKIPQTIGWNTDARSFLLTSAPKLTKEDKKIHQTHYYLNLLKKMGLKSNWDFPQLNPGAEARKKAQLIMEKENIKADFLIGIAPGAAYGKAKRWGAKNFAETAKLISEKKASQVLIFGSSSETYAGKEVKELLGNKAIDLTAKTDLLTAAALIEKCNIMLSNDSGLMHLSAALNIPLVAFFGPTDYRTTYPAAKKYELLHTTVDCAPCLKKECPLKKQICFNEITPKLAYEATLKLLGI